MNEIPKQGEQVTFVDQGDGGGNINNGVVNGESLTTTTGITYVPVWVDSRPGGREGTTIYVDVRNIR